MGKNNSLTPLLLIGGGFAAWYILSRYNTINSLNFVPRGIGISGGAVKLTLGVQNPSQNQINFNALAGSLMINGQNIGNVSDFQPVIIAPGSETPIQLLITPNLFGIAAGVLNELQGKEISSAFTAVLTGTANVNSIAVPVNVSFT